MFGHLLKESYDEEKRIFLTFEQLHPSKVTLIGETLEMVARKCIEQKKNVKTSSWGFESDTKKSEAQDVLDSILKFAYPFVSRAKKFTDINKQVSSIFNLQKITDKVNINPEAEETVMKIPVCLGPFHLDHTGLVWNRSKNEHKGI